MVSSCISGASAGGVCGHPRLGAGCLLSKGETRQYKHQKPRAGTGPTLGCPSSLWLLEVTWDGGRISQKLQLAACCAGSQRKYLAHFRQKVVPLHPPTPIWFGCSQEMLRGSQVAGPGTLCSCPLPWVLLPQDSVGGPVADLTLSLFLLSPPYSPRVCRVSPHGPPFSPWVRYPQAFSS